MERGCCEFICGAPTTSQGYGIEYNQTSINGYVRLRFGNWVAERGVGWRGGVSLRELKLEQQVIVIDLFNETVLFNHRGGRSPPRWLNRQTS